jgi:hypothetical protein
MNTVAVVSYCDTEEVYLFLTKRRKVNVIDIPDAFLTGQ